MPVRKAAVAGSGGAPVQDCVFISYRRSDSSTAARALYKFLQRRVGSKRVFMDVGSFMHGTDFPKTLNEYLDRSAVVLALMGSTWLEPQEDGRPPRLFDPNDFVRLELSTALRLQKPIIPIVLRGATLPAEEELPGDLRALLYRHAVFLG